MSFSYPITGLDRPLALQEAEAPRISRLSAHKDGRVVRFMNCLPLPPSPQGIPLVLISVEGCFEPRAIIQQEELSK
jgi:hypothetical protein